MDKRKKIADTHRNSPDTAIYTQPTPLTGAETVWATLVGEGVRDVFGYPGGAILPVYDALRKFPIRHILVRHEQGASHMADGYARASGRVGVAMATSGPGATNLVTGIATAMLDSIPMVCITGQVSSKVLGTDAFQEVDITGITLPITKHNFLVRRTEDIAPALREAFRIAQSGRPGPVLVDITKDAQQNTAVFDFAAAAPQPYRPHPMLSADSASIREALELLRTAKRPVILAGQGILHSGAMEQVRALAERTQIPVACTLLGLTAFPASHPLNLGMMGMHGESWVNQSIQQADLLIACGMRFDDRVTGSLSTYAPNAKEDSHRDRSRRDQQECSRRCRPDRRLERNSGNVAAALAGSRWRRMAACNFRHEGRRLRPRHSAAARQRSSLCRARHQRHLARHQRKRDRRHRRGPAPDVGGAILQA